MLRNPIQRPDSMLRNYILRITPLGTNIEDVIELINNRDDWGSIDVHDFVLDPSEPTLSYQEYLERPRTGEMRMRSL